ncbi:hypothetical protein ACMFMG_006379 [Clarireedia jacksonii]
MEELLDLVGSSRSPLPSARVTPLNATKQRQQPIFEGIQRAKIILGFTAIGKTHFAAKANREFEWLRVIDLSLITHEVEFTPDYQQQYFRTIIEAAREPGVLLLGGRGWVGQFLVESGLSFSSVYPRSDAIEEYKERWDEMGEEEFFIAHRLTSWDDTLAAMKYPTGRCTHYELHPRQYLEDIFLEILTSADPIDSPLSDTGRPRSRRASEASRNSRESVHQALFEGSPKHFLAMHSYVRTVLNWMQQLLQSAFILFLAIAMFLVYQEYQNWRWGNRQWQVYSIDDYNAIASTSSTSRSDYWQIPGLLKYPRFLASFFSSRGVCESNAGAAQQLINLVQRWLDAEKARL